MHVTRQKEALDKIIVFVDYFYKRSYVVFQLALIEAVAYLFLSSNSKSLLL